MTPADMDALVELAVSFAGLMSVPLIALAVVKLIDLPDYLHDRAIEKRRREIYEEEAPMRLREQQRKDRELSHLLWQEEFHNLGGCPRRYDLRRFVPWHPSVDCRLCNDQPAVDTPRRHLRSITSRKAS